MPSNAEEEQAQWTWWILRIWGIEITEMVLSLPQFARATKHMGFSRLYSMQA